MNARTNPPDPREPRPARGGREGRAPGGPRRRETILVVEDDLSVQAAVADYLRDDDFEVVTAADGISGLASALDLHARCRLDAMVLDLRLPVLSGLTMLETLRNRGIDAPAIICSGTTSVEDAAHAIRLRASDLFLKPVVDMSRLTAALRRALAAYRECKGRQAVGAGTEAPAAAGPGSRPGGAGAGLPPDLALLARVASEAHNVLASLSHELISPLNGIAGMAEALAATGLTEEQSEHVRTILATGQELAAEIEYAIGRARRAARMGMGAEVAARPAAAAGGGTSAPLTPDVRVLVVDDGAMNREVASLVLRKRLGVQADVVCSGAEALVRLGQARYDAVLMDCQMPDPDGYRTTRLIRSGEGVLDPRVPIIALTANILPENRTRCLQAGMDDFLKKPIRADRLREALERALGRRAVRSG